MTILNQTRIKTTMNRELWKNKAVWKGSTWTMIHLEMTESRNRKIKGKSEKKPFDEGQIRFFCVFCFWGGLRTGNKDGFRGPWKLEKTGLGYSEMNETKTKLQPKGQHGPLPTRLNMVFVLIVSISFLAFVQMRVQIGCGGGRFSLGGVLLLFVKVALDKTPVENHRPRQEENW